MGQSWKSQWFFNIRNDMLAGLVVALALIPEAIAFSIIAGVDPKVGLYASFCIAIVSALVGGRPGMISAATGAMALLMVTLVRDHGLAYLFAATLLTGVFQIMFGIVKLGRLLKFVPRPVMIGFVNALAILIFMAQLVHFSGASWQMYTMVAASLVIIYGFPRLTRVIPSPLVAIILMTIVSVVFDTDVRTVGDLGELPSTFPPFTFPAVPWTFETLRIIAPYALPLAMVGLLESLLTATLLDDLTDTPSNKNQEAVGQGVSNVVAGVFGGMAGCAMIGQSVINIKSGGRGRLSTLCAGVFLLVLMLVANDLLRLIPMGALVAVMFMVSIGTFDWAALKNVRFTPRSETVVMVATVAAVVQTHDLSIGVAIGVVLSAIFFVRHLANTIRVSSTVSDDGRTRTYTVHGQLFFVSTDDFLRAFDWEDSVDRMVIDLTHTHLWDSSSVGALDKVVLKGRRLGRQVDVIGLNEASATILERLALHDKEPSIQSEPAH